jgi:hypothetical protein
MFDGFSAWKANTSVLVGAVVFVVGLLVFRREEGDTASSVVLWVSFGVAFATDYLLHYREDRARERAARDGSGASPDSSTG